MGHRETANLPNVKGIIFTSNPGFNMPLISGMMVVSGTDLIFYNGSLWKTLASTT